MIVAGLSAVFWTLFAIQHAHNSEVDLALCEAILAVLAGAATVVFWLRWGWYARRWRGV